MTDCTKGNPSSAAPTEILTKRKKIVFARRTRVLSINKSMARMALPQNPDALSTTSSAASKSKALYTKNQYFKQPRITRNGPGRSSGSLSSSSSSRKSRAAAK